MMRPFTELNALAAPLERHNVDTDAIIPKQFLKSVDRVGLGKFLFDAWRYADPGELGMDCAARPKNPDFVLNQTRYEGAEILLVGENFGCGSSREHAPWALLDYGFRCVIGSSFADIFYNNCVKNGILPVVLPAEEMRALFAAVESAPGYRLHVNLAEQVVTLADGRRLGFEIEPSIKRNLLEGLDEIEQTLGQAEQIKHYERHRAEQEPWLFSSNN